MATMRIASVTKPEIVHSHKWTAILFLAVCLISWSPVLSSEWETEVPNTSPSVPEIDLDDIHEQQAAATGSGASDWEEKLEDSHVNEVAANRSSEKVEVDVSKNVEQHHVDEATPVQREQEQIMEEDTADDQQGVDQHAEDTLNSPDHAGVVDDFEENLDSAQAVEEGRMGTGQYEELGDHQSTDQPSIEDSTVVGDADSSSDSAKNLDDTLSEENLNDAGSNGSEEAPLDADDHLPDQAQEPPIPELSSQDAGEEPIQTTLDEHQAPNSETEKENDADEAPPEGSLASFMQKLKAKEGPNPMASSTTSTQATSSFEARASQQEQFNHFVEAQQATFQGTNEPLRHSEPVATPLPESPDEGKNGSIPEVTDTKEDQAATEEAPEGSLASFMQKFKGNQGEAKANPLAAATSFEALATQQQQLNEHLSGQTNYYQPPPAKETTDTQQSLEDIDHEYSGAPWGVTSAGLRHHIPDMELLYLYFQEQVRKDVGIPVAPSYKEALFPLGVGTGLDVNGMNAGWKKAHQDELRALIAAPWNNIGEGSPNDPPSPMENSMDHHSDSDAHKSSDKDLMDDLDDIGKFFQGVNAPDELDVGAASGSSMQELIMSKSRQILVQQAKKGYDMIRSLWNGDSSEDDIEWEDGDDKPRAWSVRNLFQSGAGAVRWVTNVVVDIMEGGDSDSSSGKDAGDKAMKDFPRVNLEEIRKLSSQGLRNDEN
eukprot:Nitzschia sp. Nitz4//scaffold89_size161592//49721//51862//NITZ4_002371-RA/size161592-processed-gene-0.218-mRNA-1//-1//CDS//3329559595//5620//frame0